MTRSVQVTPTRLDEEGRGVGEAEGREVHVAFALPGETVRARIEHVSPHAPLAWGVVEEVLDPSPERVAPLCPGWGRCGGCVLQHLAYPAQLSAKRQRLERALAAYPSLAGLRVDDVVASPRESQYRNKAKYVLAPRSLGGLVFGSYAPRTHEVVDMAGCQVPEPPLDAVARAAVRALAAERLPVYDERRRAGELRYLVVRANHEGRVLIVIVARTVGPRAALARIGRAVRAERPEVAGVVMNVNATTGGALFGDEEHVLDGAGALADLVAGVRLELSARAFFQVNRAQAGRLYEEVARAARARGGTRVVDLYTGVGGIALALASRGARAVGVELLPSAVEDARRSARAAGLAARAHFEMGDAARGLRAAAARLGGVDVVVVNPPRKGLRPGALEAVVAAAPPRLVYVSCGPESLARDLDALVAAGFCVESLRPYDLMPGTPHVETVAALVRPAAPGGRATPRA